jgi:hypothetical protein
MPMHYPEGSYIYVLVCTLDKLSRIPGSKGLPNWSKHWAILVGGFCFEVKRGRDGVKRGQGGVKRGQDGNPDTIRGLPFHEWKRENPNWNKRFIKVGVTTKDWENIVLDCKSLK